jgi:HEPN domain-containing protein
MNATVREWVDKAEGDYATATREFGAGPAANLDAVCFHAQQCAEKLMKALLIYLGVVPPRSHDLELLSRFLGPVCPGWSWPANELRFLTRASVDFRYPGDTADRDEARDALQIAASMREKLRLLLGLATS